VKDHPIHTWVVSEKLPTPTILRHNLQGAAK